MHSAIYAKVLWLLVHLLHVALYGRKGVFGTEAFYLSHPTLYCTAIRVSPNIKYFPWNVASIFSAFSSWHFDRHKSITLSGHIRLQHVAVTQSVVLIRLRWLRLVYMFSSVAAMCEHTIKDGATEKHDLKMTDWKMTDKTFSKFRTKLRSLENAGLHPEAMLWQALNVCPSFSSPAFSRPFVFFGSCIFSSINRWCSTAKMHSNLNTERWTIGSRAVRPHHVAHLPPSLPLHALQLKLISADCWCCRKQDSSAVCCRRDAAVVCWATDS